MNQPLVPTESRDREWIPSPRRVRIRFADRWIADSDRVMLLRQHGFLPVLYIPEDDVARELLVACEHETWSPYKGRAIYRDVVVEERRARGAAWTYPDPLPGSPDTRGYWSFDFHAMDAWFEEDERLFVHARDPLLRVDALRSDRRVTVGVADMLVADTRRPVLIFETGLVTRFYIPPADVAMARSRPSDTLTRCPYKGVATYLDFEIDGERHEDVAWRYPSPLPEVAAVADHICFFAERPDVRIAVDGDPLPRLGVRPDPDGGELLTPSRVFWTVPAPAAMLGRGERQHDFSRPNRRAEGPPDELIDMDIERAGGRRAELLEALGRGPDGGPRGPVAGVRRVPASPDQLFTSGPGKQA